MVAPRVRTAAIAFATVVGAAAALGACTGNGSPPNTPTQASPSPSQAASASPTPSPQPTSGDIELALTEGSSVRMAGEDIDGRISSRTPVQVSYESAECADTFPGMGQDLENFEPTDLEAPAGKLLCLVTLEVKNLAKEEVSFGTETAVMLRASDGKEYPVTKLKWSADPEKNFEAEDVGEPLWIEPGDTGPANFMFEVPNGQSANTLIFVDYGQ